jgi:uncharacterized protein YbjT (DUF2867 family)
MRVLVTGATGNVGSAAATHLRDLGVTVRAAARSGAAFPGMESAALDLHAPETWDAALDGVDGLFLLRPPAISDVGPTLNALVDRGRGRLKHVVFLSVAGAEKNTVIPHAKVEKHLRSSGIPWTFLRAGFFGQNLCGPYREDIRDDDRLYVPAGQEAVSWVDTRDLGEAAARAFLTEDARGQAWLLTGREARTYQEVAGLLSEELGRSIRYQPASVPGYLYHLRRRRGLPWAPAVVYTVLHTAIRMGAERRVDPTLAAVLGRPPRTIADTITDHLDLWY